MGQCAGESQSHDIGIQFSEPRRERGKERKRERKRKKKKQKKHNINKDRDRQISDEETDGCILQCLIT